MSDDRIKKSAGANRDDRKMQDRAVSENRELSEDERVAMFRQQFFQSSLPDLPKINGYHTCWLTTTNPRDSIQGRIRLGYEPVLATDVPGWEYATMKTGEYQGFIGVNEMLAFKLPVSLYERFMQEAHHSAPLREEEKLKDTTDFLASEAKNSKSAVIVEEGMANVVANRKPVFDLD